MKSTDLKAGKTYQMRAGDVRRVIAIRGRGPNRTVIWRLMGRGEVERTPIMLFAKWCRGEFGG